MPKANHKQSRLFFINEAKKLYQKEFIKWFKLTAEINPLLKYFKQMLKQAVRKLTQAVLLTLELTENYMYQKE